MLARVIALSIGLLLSVTAANALDPPYVLVDMETGQVLGQRDSGELWYPASLTKLMTVYLLFEAIDEGRLQLDSPVPITANSLTVSPSRMNLPAGSVITVENALKILIVKSANDVAISVAEMMEGSEQAFIAEMNRKAAELGMIATRFVNPHGLPGSGQYTTARDMALLARTIWLRFPQFRDLFAIAEIRYGTQIMPTGNSLIEFYAGANGMKTGYICSAGFNLVATATRGGDTLIAVILGAPSPLERATTTASLLDAGFATAEPYAGPTLATYRPGSSVRAPVDRRPEICGQQTDAGDEDVEPVDPRDLLIAAFGEPDPLPPPVTVFVGGVDLAARIQVDVPLPEPRPTLIDDASRFIPLPRPRPADPELRL